MAFYAFEYLDYNQKCTFGTPHPRTRKHDIAGHTHKFRTRETRDYWVEEGWGYSRTKLNKKELRSHNLGSSVADLAEHLERMDFTG